MTKTLYEVGRSGLQQFIIALANVIEHDVELTDAQAASVPTLLFRAEMKLLQAWDELCCGCSADSEKENLTKPR